MTHLRRTRAALRHRLTGGSPMIVLIVVALLAGAAGFGAASRQETSASVTSPSPTGERSVERMRGAPFEHGGVRRAAFLRATAGAVARIHVSSGAGGSDGPRTALGAAPTRLELAAHRVAVQRADVRHRHVPLPALPALSSRAPPTV